MYRIGFLVALCATLLWATGPGAVFAGDDPAKIYEEVCKDCHHSPKKMKQLDDAHLTQKEWKELVERMITDNNAEIRDEEIPGLVEYLAKNHGPLEGAAAQPK